MMNKNELELYVHIPFCTKKCDYCDFLSFTSPMPVQRAYVDKLIEEILNESVECLTYNVSSIFIGGGTPSLISSDWIEDIMKAIRKGFHIRDKAEITIEVNPGTVNIEKLQSYRDAGINRVSIGLQSADDGELKNIGRIHTYDDFLKTYQRVRLAGFTNVNVDLMSALPGQTMASWEKTLKKVLMLKPEHISAYSLIIEAGTPFFEYYGHGAMPGIKPLPEEETERQMYYVTKQTLKEHGYNRYEISNYSKPGYECQHNLGYWTGVDYLGLGLGSSSYRKGYRFRNENDLKTYLALPMDETGEDRLHLDTEQLSLKTKMEEFMFLGLRLSQGVSGSDFVAMFGQNMWNIYGGLIKRMEDQGLLQVEMPYVRLTERGVDLSNYVMGQFLL